MINHFTTSFKGVVRLSHRVRAFLSSRQSSLILFVLMMFWLFPSLMLHAQPKVSALSGPYRNQGFGFGFKLHPIVWSPEHVYAKHVQVSKQRGQIIAWAESGADERGFEKVPSVSLASSRHLVFLLPTEFVLTQSAFIYSSFSYSSLSSLASPFANGHHTLRNLSKDSCVNCIQMKCYWKEKPKTILVWIKGILSQNSLFHQLQCSLPRKF